MKNMELMKGAKIEAQTEGLKEYYIIFRDKVSPSSKLLIAKPALQIRLVHSMSKTQMFLMAAITCQKTSVSAKSEYLT